MPQRFTFSKVPIAKAGEAFACHTSIAKSNAHIWPRTEDEIRRYCEEGSLFCVRGFDGQLVALCYSILDAEAWEIGGLTVDGSLQNLGIGTTLVRFVLAHTMVFTQPWENKQRVIAHIHEENNDPRNIFRRLGFVHVRQIAVPAGNAPESMRRNAKGEIVGDELEFSKDGLIQLARWLNSEFDGTLGLAKVPADLHLESGGLADMKVALADMATRTK